MAPISPALISHSLPGIQAHLLRLDLTAGMDCPFLGQSASSALSGSRWDKMHGGQASQVRPCEGSKHEILKAFRLHLSRSRFLSSIFISSSGLSSPSNWRKGC